MDDEIDIDEHDILEHPQVKAVFPDISKIQIHLHASQASSLDEMLTEPESGNLLEERPDYADTDLDDNLTEDDVSQTAAQQCENEEGNYENDNLEDNVLVINNVIEETHEISDSETDDEPLAPVIDSQQDIVEEGNSYDFEHEANTQIISKERQNEDQEIGKPHEEILDKRHNSIPQMTENVLQISDDEVDSTKLTANCNVIIDNALNNSFRLFEDASDLNQFIVNDSQMINEFIEEVPENDVGLIKEIAESYDGFTGENLENNDGTIEEYQEDQFTDINKAIQDNVDSEYYDEEATLEEYHQISIKKEMEFDLGNLSDFDETLPEESFNNDELPPEDIYHFKNKIILGSKPSPLGQGVDSTHTIDEKSLLVVMLEDWSVHLSQSQTYCKDCKTLFTTSNALDAHRMTAHSLLAPIATNRAVKSTALSSVNVARKSTANKNTTVKELSNSTFCNHCNVTFKDHTALIKHLYKLLPANQYACHFCDATFQKQSDLVKHNSEHIKLEMPRKYLKAKKGTDNPILRKMLSVKTDPNSLKRCHPAERKLAEKQSVNMKRSLEIKKEPVTNQCRYKCLVCSDVFECYAAARAHRPAHPRTPLTDLIKRLLTKRRSPNSSKHKLTYEEGTNKKMKEARDNPFQLIPTCALFQCSKCDIHFLSSVAAQSHATGNTCNYKNIWCCPTCKRSLRKRDKSCHTRQHERSTKLKIYKITKNTYERTLCRCLKCDVHFEYIPLWRHLRSCGKLPTGKCNTCNILFPKQKLVEHIKKHEIMKLKKKDFILVDYAVVKNKSKTFKSKTRTNPLLPKKIKPEPKITIKTEPGMTKIKSKIVNKLKFECDKLKMYFCKHCKCCMLRNRRKKHLTKQCLKRPCTSHCKHCGLGVSEKSRKGHEKLHVIRKLTLNDFAFYDFATLKPIAPPMPEYPCCKKCNIRFLNRSMILNHICGEDYENCVVCGDKFEISALEVHLAIHRLLSAPEAAPSRPKMIPELMMKYESLNAIWNILFICGKCELVTDVYNKAVEHSQTHLNKDSQPNTIKCYICNMKFDESCWSKHSELHSRMSLNNKDFKILKYMPENLLDESWFQMFESLPEQEIRQIIDRSVFGNERSLKMRLVKDGLPEFTLHCCSSCHVCFDNNDILNHVSSRCESSKHVCRYCGIAFDSTTTLHFHNLLHNKGIKKEEFRIVHFVKPDDTKPISKLKETLNKTKHVVSKTAELKVDKKVVKKSCQYVLYKCKECTVCVQLKMNLSYHVCAPDHHLTYCRVCKQHFSFRQMSAHRAKHNKQHDFRAKNIKIISFEPTPDGAHKPRYADRKVPKSSTSKSARSKQVDSVHVLNKPTGLDDSEIEPETWNSPPCSSPNRFESPDLKTSKNLTSVIRTTLHRSRDNNTRGSSNTDHPEDKKTAKLYKCDCGLHYTSSRSIEQHIETCDSSDDISKEHCSKCGLLFPTDVLVSHLCQHHSQDTRLCVQPVHRPRHHAARLATKASSEGGIKLYKCSECNVYFLNQSSCYKHISKHVPLDPKEYIECKMCCLQFRILSLHIHMRKHHERDFNLDKVLVEEYQPSVGKQAPRIDIYYANDRFQSVQVSSSND